ncbi:hypothetical protein CPter291_4338 [Collimonas pratensis]|uniref:Uncharacterized protein n=1 Tax=Collimonas pratensis TaxID=279113 RepID=A0ABN4MG65_9BURK|nr:hypothetical protein CPter291_4338 [Collimonas pratensis]
MPALAGWIGRNASCGGRIAVDPVNFIQQRKVSVHRLFKYKSG